MRAKDAPAENRLLKLLPPAVLARLTPHLEQVSLSRKEVLFRANEPLRACYFPNTAVVSLVSTLESGDSLEVGLIGRDGLAGTSVCPGIFTMPCDGIVQISGVAQRVRADDLRAEVLAKLDVLEWLAAAKFLCRNGGGMYARLTEGRVDCAWPHGTPWR